MEFSALQATDISGALRERVDDSWVEINKIQDSVGTFLFAKLSKVMLGILTIPHSNASCERIFSCVRKNKTDQRASLSADMFYALLVLKMKSGDINSRKYSTEELRQIKSCYYNSLNN